MAVKDVEAEGLFDIEISCYISLKKFNLMTISASRCSHDECAICKTLLSSFMYFRFCHWTYCLRCFSNDTESVACAAIDFFQALLRHGIQICNNAVAAEVLILKIENNTEKLDRLQLNCLWLDILCNRTLYIITIQCESASHLFCAQVIRDSWIKLKPTTLSFWY